MTSEDIRAIQRSLSWQPIFGCSLRIGYFEVLQLTLQEVDELFEWIADTHRKEWKAVFGKGGR